MVNGIDALADGWWNKKKKKREKQTEIIHLQDICINIKCVVKSERVRETPFRILTPDTM